MSALVFLALAGCIGFDGPSPFMDVYWDEFDADPCRHLWSLPTLRAQVETCENDWMRNRIEAALLTRYPLGSDIRGLVRYLEMEDFICIKFDKRSSQYNTENYKCYFDSIEQDYGPASFLSLPIYPFEMKWRITIYYYDRKILWLESWNEKRREGKR